MIPQKMLAVGGAALIVGGACGWTVRDWKADADALKAAGALMEAKDEAAARIDRQAADFEAFRQSLDPVRTETRNTIREVYRDVPVPADCALHPDALGVLENARRRANAAATGEPFQPLPAGAAGPAARP